LRSSAQGRAPRPSLLGLLALKLSPRLVLLLLLLPLSQLL